MFDLTKPVTADNHAAFNAHVEERLWKAYAALKASGRITVYHDVKSTMNGALLREQVLELEARVNA